MPIIYAQYLHWYWYLKVTYWYLDHWYWYWYLFVEYLIQDCIGPWLITSKGIHGGRQRYRY